MNTKKETGQQAEELAVSYLAKKGWRILGQNFKTKIGEIDILAEDRKTLVLVEVKAKTSDQFGLASEMVNPAKQRKLRQLASFLETKFPKRPIRIDVVAVDWSDNWQKPNIEHIVSAVEE